MGIILYGMFHKSFGYEYIILAVDYVSKWIETKATRHDDGKFVVAFLRGNIFSRFGVSKALIINQGSHLCNRVVAQALKHYSVKHRTSTAYHLQTSSQGEICNRKIKIIFENMVKPNKRD